MQKILRLIRLVRFIIRKGKYHGTGVDHAQERRDALKDVLEFCPARWVGMRMMSAAPKRTYHHSFVKTIVAELAFLGSRLRSEGGHLSVPRLNLNYVRIPKAASTAMSSAVLHARYPGLKVYSLSAKKINYLADANLQTTITDENMKATFFTLVRNPFARIVSVYREYFEGKPEDFIYEDYLFGIFRHAVSFAEFVRTLHLIPDLLKDQHVKPQHLFLEYYHRKNIQVKIFSLEQPAAWKDFLAAYSLRVEVIHASAIPYDYRLYFDKETLEIARDIYHDDVALFGYDGVYAELLQLVQSRAQDSRGD